MDSPAPILVADLYPELRERLLALLESLTEEEWHRPTAAGKWTVKDVALHLLGGDVSSLSRRRDRFAPPLLGRSLSDWNDLVSYINWLNATWVEATQRMSTRLLCDLLAFTGPQLSEYFKSLDPFALGEPVSWAGPERAPQWLDVAREYTEQWHHQQQIRDATARPGLYEPRLFTPVIDTFVRALPRTFSDVPGSEGTAIRLVIPGPAGGSWTVRRVASRWRLELGANFAANSEITLAAEDAWKIFTRGIRGDAALRCAKVNGDHALGIKVLETVSVIA